MRKIILMILFVVLFVGCLDDEKRESPFGYIPSMPDVIEPDITLSYKVYGSATNVKINDGYSIYDIDLPYNGTIDISPEEDWSISVYHYDYSNQHSFGMQLYLNSEMISEDYSIGASVPVVVSYRK